MKKYLTSSQVTEEEYSVLSDYIYEHRNVPLQGVEPFTSFEIRSEDCYLNEEGCFFAPIAYEMPGVVKGSEDFTPVYGDAVLSKEEVEHFIAVDKSFN